MKKAFVLFCGILVLLLLVVTLGSCTKSDFYISPDGDDANPGTKRKPFRSIDQAQNAVRDILADGQTGDLTVWIDEGIYQISEPLELGPEDSGQEDDLIYFRAVPGTQPVISGGVQISGWEKSDEGYWIARVEPNTIKDGTFRELFIDGERANRARNPDDSYQRAEEIGVDERTNFFFKAGTFPEPEDPRTVEILFRHSWSISRVSVAEIDYSERKITLTHPVGGLDFMTLARWGCRYRLENSLAFLDTPGEWFFDRGNGMLYLMMADGQDPNDSEIMVPSTGPHLLLISGNKQQKVKNIHFEGITFKYCSWLLPDKGYGGIQAAHYGPNPTLETWSAVPSAVQVTWARNCSFTNCHFQHLGGSGLQLGMGCSGCSVTDSWFEDISGNGVMVGDGKKHWETYWWETYPEELAEDNSVSGCTVTGIGKQFEGAVGIWAGITAGTTIRDNHVYNLPYTGISTGWVWGPVLSLAKNNRIAGNHIHNVMESLSDGGGIYTLGRQPGTTISGNLIHDVCTKRRGTSHHNGIFCDNGTSEFTMSANIIYNIPVIPIRFNREGTDNLIKDNIISCKEEDTPIRSRDVRLENNTILSDSIPEHQEILENAVEQWKSNP